MSLSRKQYTLLADLAKKAWNAQSATERAEYERRAADHHNDPLVSAAKVFDFWRREMQLKRIGKSSMADMANRHFVPLKQLWLDLAAGKSPREIRLAGPAITAIAGLEDDRRRKLYVLARETRRAGFAWPDYPAAVAADQHPGVPLEKLNGTDLLHLIYTIRSRAKARRKKTPP